MVSGKNCVTSNGATLEYRSLTLPRYQIFVFFQFRLGGLQKFLSMQTCHSQSQTASVSSQHTHLVFCGTLDSLKLFEIFQQLTQSHWLVVSAKRPIGSGLCRRWTKEAFVILIMVDLKVLQVAPNMFQEISDS